MIGVLALFAQRVILFSTQRIRLFNLVRSCSWFIARANFALHEGALTILERRGRAIARCYALVMTHLMR